MIDDARLEGKANQASGFFGHKIDGLRRYAFGGQNQVTFVLAIFVIDHYDHPALLNDVDGFAYSGDQLILVYLHGDTLYPRLSEGNMVFKDHCVRQNCILSPMVAS
jgi:hypothetical protein